MTLRDKISNIFGFRLTSEETFSSYLNRMDRAGQCDQSKLLKLIVIALETLDASTETPTKNV